MLIESALGVMDDVIKLVSDLNSFLKLAKTYSLLLILFLHLLGDIDHLVDLILGETS
jgi:hypothetical protein